MMVEEVMGIQAIVQNGGGTTSTSQLFQMGVIW